MNIIRQTDKSADVLLSKIAFFLMKVVFSLEQRLTAAVSTGDTGIQLKCFGNWENNVTNTNKRIKLCAFLQNN